MKNMTKETQCHCAARIPYPTKMGKYSLPNNHSPQFTCVYRGDAAHSAKHGQLF